MNNLPCHGSFTGSADPLLSLRKTCPLPVAVRSDPTLTTNRMTTVTNMKPQSQWTDDEWTAHFAEDDRKRKALSAYRDSVLSRVDAGDWENLSSHEIDGLVEGAESLIDELRVAADGLEETVRAAEEAAAAVSGLEMTDEDDRDPDDVRDAEDALARLAENIGMYDPENIMSP